MLRDADLQPPTKETPTKRNTKQNPKTQAPNHNQTKKESKQK
jgi:hypothetical protein